MQILRVLYAFPISDLLCVYGFHSKQTVDRLQKTNSNFISLLILKQNTFYASASEQDRYLSLLPPPYSLEAVSQQCEKTEIREQWVSLVTYTPCLLIAMFPVSSDSDKKHGLLD